MFCEDLQEYRINVTRESRSEEWKNSQSTKLRKFRKSIKLLD